MSFVDFHVCQLVIRVNFNSLKIGDKFEKHFYRVCMLLGPLFFWINEQKEKGD